MTEDRPTKTCKTCYEQVDPRAVACRHCGYLQRGPTVWAINHIEMLGGILSLGLLANIVLPFVWTQTLYQRIWGRGEDFAGYREQLKVISSEVHFHDANEGNTVSVVGKLRNDSDVDWNKIQIEVQFTNAAGRLIDVIRRIPPRDGPRALAHTEAGFKVTAPREFPRDNYASHKVFVRYAKDAKSAW